ncbi:putative ribonuclease H-like domain-containing protein [Tanacetum coccineum]
MKEALVIKNKARLVAQGYTQEEGIDYDEVFAPVARIEAIRLFLAYASFKDFVGTNVTPKNVSTAEIFQCFNIVALEVSKGANSLQAEVENLIDKKVKVIRCDNGTEFKNKEMNQFCERKCIKREFSIARSSQQNRVAERKNKTLIKAARTMLADFKLPITFWTEVVNIACYVQNRTLVTKPHNKTPYELFLGRKPVLGFMRPFGKAFRVFNSRTRIVEENLRVQFSENTPNIARSGPNWLFDIDALTKSMNYKPVVTGNQSNDNTGTKAYDGAGKARMETSSPDAEFKPSGDNEKKVTEEARKEGGDSNNDQEKEDDNVNNTNNVNTASDGNNTNNVNAVSSTINAASIEVNAVGAKTRIELLDDPNMPELEDIVYSDDDEDVGTEADMNNLNTFMHVNPIPTTRIHKDHLVEQIIGDLNSAPQTRRMTKNLEEHGYTQEEGIDYDEVFAPVARIEEIRLFLAYTSFKDFVVYQMDVKSAFLYDKIEEEVYVCQSPGFEDPDFPGRVYKVERHFMDYIKLLELGLQVKQKEDGIFISQDTYVTEILKKFGFTYVKTASTPMETQKPLLKDEDGEEVDVHLYRLMIGSVMYLTSLRPNIMFAVCACARYQVNPKVSHLYAVKRIFSDYARASLDKKSTIGGCQFLGCRLISWQCKKQIVVANSTTEAEYVADSSCCGQVWIFSKKEKNEAKQTKSNTGIEREDAFKHGRKIANIDVDAEVTLIDETQGRNDDNLMFDTCVLDEQGS